MTKTKRPGEQGFSAVELLITLFVAAAFLATGYQLYYTVLERSGQLRLRAIAANIAYDKLRFYAAKATAPCTSKTNTTLGPTLPANHGLGSASINVSLNCPYGTSSDVTRVDVRISYGAATNQEQVKHNLYVTPNL